MRHARADSLRRVGRAARCVARGNRGSPPPSAQVLAPGSQQPSRCRPARQIDQPRIRRSLGPRPARPLRSRPRGGNPATGCAGSCWSSAVDTTARPLPSPIVSEWHWGFGEGRAGADAGWGPAASATPSSYGGRLGLLGLPQQPRVPLAAVASRDRLVGAAIPPAGAAAPVQHRDCCAGRRARGNGRHALARDPAATRGRAVRGWSVRSDCHARPVRPGDGKHRVPPQTPQTPQTLARTFAP